MTEEKLDRELRSVGKDAFVSHFNLFQACAAEGGSLEACIKDLVNLGRSNFAGASRRCGAARRIFKANREIDALQNVCGSKKVNDDGRAQAGKLIDERAERPTRETTPAGKQANCSG